MIESPSVKHMIKSNKFPICQNSLMFKWNKIYVKEVSSAFNPNLD